MKKYTFTTGGKKGTKKTLYESNNRLVVRTRNARQLKNAVYSEEGRAVLNNFTVEQEFPEADVSILKVRDQVNDSELVRDNARLVLKNEKELRFAGRALLDEDKKTPVIYTGNLIIKFADEVIATRCEEILLQNNLTIKDRPAYAKNIFFVSAPEDTGTEIFDLASRLLKMNEVELCHPEIIRRRSLKKIHPNQWHLISTTINGLEIHASILANKAHEKSKGDKIIIAIIDDGFDIDHQEFNQPGKVIHSRDVTYGTNDPRPKSGYNNHGTACAGVAVASGIEASGVAPAAILMPIRLSSGLGSYSEATAFKWAADHGADIISCSWGPEDGYWADMSDPLHNNRVDLPDHTRLAIDYALKNGRKGLGCLITFAAGNGNEKLENDGYAGYNGVIAVAACNDTCKRSVYSDYGKNVWCCFPSNDVGYGPFNHPEPLTPGIFTTDRKGMAGYNENGDYTSDFGGTSSACPGVAGTIALVLAVNPLLTQEQVKDILKDTSDKIDSENGLYDKNGHSIYYGYGRVNALKAVEFALNYSKQVVPER